MRSLIKKLNLSERAMALARRPAFWAVMGLCLLLAGTGAAVGVWSTQQPPPQPIAFNHQIHIKLKVQCLYCHPGAWRSASAGLPTSAKCWGCHQQIPVKNGAQQALADYVASGQPIPWVPVAIQPDFVYFNHRPHIAAALNCETCHGEISRMQVAEPQPGMNMGWCLDCHRTRAKGDPVKLAKLTDCATCHR
jgi:hypothetical protein